MILQIPAAAHAVYRLCRMVSVCLGMLFAAVAGADESGQIRVGVLKFGTVNWELNAIQYHQFDQKNGVELHVTELGSKNATAVALQSGAVDLIVSDWIWVSRQRNEGRRFSFVPYSRAVGGVMVRPGSGIDSLVQLQGRKLGVGGGPVDKSWLVLRAYAKQNLGIELAEAVEPTYGAPPLLNQLIRQGDLPAVVNFWHYNARLRADGMRELITIQDILPQLGVDKTLPLLGWVFSDDLALNRKTALVGFLKASLQAKNLMLNSDEEWIRLQSLTKAGDFDTLVALRDAWRSGVPEKFTERSVADAQKLFAILSREGGTRLTGARAELNPGTFWTDFDLNQSLP